MEPVTLICGRAVPLDRSDVDTDQIIPAEWLKRVERTGFEAGLFAAWRQSPDFALNRPEHHGATVLVAGRNFGCGSSREHAVWALQQYGFRAVVSPGFADIFRANCNKNGVVAVEVTSELGARLMAAVQQDPGLEVVVDIERRTVEVAAVGIAATFELDDFTRYRFLEGLDDVDLTLQHASSIARYERGRLPWLPRLPPR